MTSRYVYLRKWLKKAWASMSRVVKCCYCTGEYEKWFVKDPRTGFTLFTLIQSTSQRGKALKTAIEYNFMKSNRISPCWKWPTIPQSWQFASQYLQLVFELNNNVEMQKVSITVSKSNLVISTSFLIILIYWFSYNQNVLKYRWRSASRRQSIRT